MTDSIDKYNDLPNDIITKFETTYLSNYYQGLDNFKSSENINISIEIQRYQKNTGIMIGDFYISQNEYIYILVFDDQILVVDQFQLPLFQTFFNDNCKEVELFYLNSHCTNIMEDLKSTEINQLKQEEILSTIKNQPKFKAEINKQILKCIIKKSKIRTFNRHQKLKSDPGQFNMNTEFNLSDFVFVKKFSNNVSLQFNVNDQYLYILKKFDIFNQQIKTQYEHEIEFYIVIENKQPFISKFYGQINQIQNLLLLNTLKVKHY